MNPSKNPIQGLLGKDCAGAQVHHRHPTSDANTEGKNPECNQMVGWWILSAQPDCKENTGAMMSMGSVSIMELLRKKNTNGGSSTKTKIVGDDNSLPQWLWSIYFIEGQGCAVEELKFHQDNMSAMIMERMRSIQERSGQSTSLYDTTLLGIVLRTRTSHWNTAQREKCMHIYSPGNCKKQRFRNYGLWCK